MIKLNKEFFTGLTLGFGAGVVVGTMFTKEKRSFKGLSKEIIRASLLSVEKIKESAVRFKENFEDITAEVENELKHKATTQEGQVRKETAKVRKTQFSSKMN